MKRRLHRRPRSFIRIRKVSKNESLKVPRRGHKSSNGNTQGELDICLDGLYKYGETQEFIKCQLQKQSQWILQDYFKKDIGPQKSAYFLFESKQAFSSEPNRNNKYLKKEGNFQKENSKLKISKKILSEAWTRNISQIFKELIAFKIYMANLDRMDTQEKLFGFMAEKGDEEKVTIFKEEPYIVFYYFADSGITQDQFEQQIKCIKPLMRYWFDTFNATFNICGFNPKTKTQRELQKGIHETMNEIQETNKGVQELKEGVQETKNRLEKLQKQFFQLKDSLENEREFSRVVNQPE